MLKTLIIATMLLPRLAIAIPATTATETARPMVSRGLGGERRLLRADGAAVLCPRPAAGIGAGATRRAGEG